METPAALSVSSPGAATVLLLLLIITIILLLSTVSTSRSIFQDGRRRPPGPRPLPVLGNLLQLDHKKPQKTFMEWSKEHGSVFTVFMGQKEVVVLSGFKAVKEALVNYADEFGGRDPTRIVHEYNQGHGIIWSNGDSWKEMRRFALARLRDFGMGKKESEHKIVEECDLLTEELRKHRGKSFDISQLLLRSVSNIICSLVYGSRFDYNDPHYVSLINQTVRRNQLMVSPSIQLYNMFPRLCKWIANRREFHRIGDANKKQNLQMFSRLKETLDPQTCRGFVDAFLVRKENLEGSGIQHFHDDNLLKSVANLFTAGTETIATTLRWGLMLMAKYPRAQDQVQDELRRVVGSRQVLLEDRKNLPFTNAVIHETQRVANIAPLGLPHKTTRDVTFRGLFIEKGTTVFPLLTSVLYDESEWERPHSFNPAHFLDKDGNFVKRDAFMPFSAGRRVCLGESLARTELFLFFSTLLQRFCFCPTDEGSALDENLLHLNLNPSLP